MKNASSEGLRLHLCLFAVLASLVLNPAAVIADDEAPGVDQLIAQIRSEPSARVRDHDAQELFILLKGLHERGETHTLSDDTIDELAALLADDAVMLSVVSSVRFVGPRADRLVPALQAAHARSCARLRERNCSILGFAGTFMIEGVLKEITGDAPSCCPEFSAS